MRLDDLKKVRASQPPFTTKCSKRRCRLTIERMLCDREERSFHSVLPTLRLASPRATQASISSAVETATEQVKGNQSVWFKGHRIRRSFAPSRTFLTNTRPSAS